MSEKETKNPQQPQPNPSDGGFTRGGYNPTRSGDKPKPPAKPPEKPKKD